MTRPPLPRRAHGDRRLDDEDRSRVRAASPSGYEWGRAEIHAGLRRIADRLARLVAAEPGGGEPS